MYIYRINIFYMKKYLLFIALFILTIEASWSQQNIFRTSNIISPEINANHTVTFRLLAPEAKAITITGDWLPMQGYMRAPAPMVKGDSGMWTYTSPVLPSDLYSYTFSVDGVKCIDPNNAYVLRDVANIFSFFIVGGGKGNDFMVNEVPHGTVSHRWYSSPGNKMTRRITIYTPPGYENSNEKYPVLYLLHGIGGDEDAWGGLGRTAEIMDNLIAQKKAVPMIVVMPNGNVSQEAAPGEGSEGMVKPSFMLPHTMDGKFEETFPDIMKFVESNYRVKANKENRAIAGLSMGGFHTAFISRYYPNTFDYVGLFSPALNVKSEQAEATPVYQNIDQKLEQQMRNGYKLYWIAIGKDDFLYKNVEDYRKKLDGMGMKYEYMESTGGHTWTNWRDYLLVFAPKLFK